MSFGYPDRAEDSCNSLHDAIRNARGRGIHIFAGASNSGARAEQPAYPARMREAFCIYTGDGYGNSGRTNPTAPQGDIGFLTLGEAVNSAWPRSLSKPPHEKRSSGTSCATPIVAGIAAFLIHYVRQELGEEMAKRCKSYDTMQALLLLMSNANQTNHSFIFPWAFFKQEKEDRNRILRKTINER
jgi:hypothetical protein